jgi:plastocyanin
MLSFILLALLSAPNSEKRATVSGVVRIKGASGANAAPVVVYLTGFVEEAESGAHVKMTQRDQSFLPAVLPLAVGATVDFANEDPIWHNVFSISKARAFDLGMTKKPETKSITFAKTGVIDVFCNIHPQMVGTILVLPNRAFTIADKDGRYRIGNVPAGEYKAYAWSRRSDVISKPVTTVAGESTSLDWEVTQDKEPPQHKNKFGNDYKGGAKY